MNAIAVGFVVLAIVLGSGSIAEPAGDAPASLEDAAHIWEATAELAVATHRSAIESFSLVTDGVTEPGHAPSSSR